jgi:hypothetical protein
VRNPFLKNIVKIEQTLSVAAAEVLDELHPGEIDR